MENIAFLLASKEFQEHVVASFFIYGTEYYQVQISHNWINLELILKLKVGGTEELQIENFCLSNKVPIKLSKLRKCDTD